MTSCKHPSSLVPMPPPFLSSICVHNNTRERSCQPYIIVNTNGRGLGTRLHLVEQSILFIQTCTLDYMYSQVISQKFQCQNVLIVDINSYMPHYMHHTCMYMQYNGIISLVSRLDEVLGDALCSHIKGEGDDVVSFQWVLCSQGPLLMKY